MVFDKSLCHLIHDDQLSASKNIQPTSFTRDCLRFLSVRSTSMSGSDSPPDLCVAPLSLRMAMEARRFHSDRRLGWRRATEGSDSRLTVGNCFLYHSWWLTDCIRRRADVKAISEFFGDSFPAFLKAPAWLSCLSKVCKAILTLTRLFEWI